MRPIMLERLSTVAAPGSYLYRPKVSNDNFIPMTKRLRTTLQNRQKAVKGDYVFPGRYGGHKGYRTIEH